MRQKKSDGRLYEDMSWLLDVTESRQPLSESSPIWVRRGEVTEGPPTPNPERHPYCEISLVIEGTGISMIEGEQLQRGPGELLLLGPGLPHWGKILKFPLKFITIYFLPWVLVEMGPETDGVRILRRFTAKQSAAQRLVRSPPRMRHEFVERFEEIDDEFAQRGFGREVRLRTLLLELLVRLLRWEQSLGRNIGGEELESDWQPILKTLQYLRKNYTEPIYAGELARAVGVSESRLKYIFQQALGTSWVKFLQSYRIHRAAALLNEGGHNVTEAAMQVGFDSLSHFNVTFRSFMGVTPKDYGRTKVSKTKKGVKGRKK
ncbi:MAG: AraC family transcriptional regulator [Verrucomicrobiota bacterium]